MESLLPNRASNQRQHGAEAAVKIKFYTDPLCCWSWAFQPQIEALRINTAGIASWELIMAGLIPDWRNYHDEVNSVMRPGQMGPIWMHAGQIAGRPIQQQLWFLDPPASSYPACLAVKCAQLQSEPIGFEMLSALWEACMTNGQNIAKKEVLLTIAAELSSGHTAFDFLRFKQDFIDGKAVPALRSDLASVTAERITRFPALTIRAGGKALLVSGRLASDTILSAINEMI